MDRLSPSSTPLRRWLIVAPSVAALVLTGCSGGGGPDTGVPTPAPSAAPLVADGTTHLTRRLVDGGTYTIAVPADLEERRGEYAGGVSVGRWAVPHPKGPLTTAISVVVEAKPSRGLREQAASLERSLLEDNVEVERTGLVWPGADAGAQLIRWREELSGNTQPRRVWQLMAQRRNGTIYNVVAYAPDSEFQASELASMMSTFTIKP